MSRLLGTFRQNVSTFASWNQTTPCAIRLLCALNVGFFGLYTLSNGPRKLWLKRVFTLQPTSNVQALLTYHVCPTTWL